VALLVSGSASEEGAEHSAGDAARLIYATELVQFALIEPDSTALFAFVNLHLLGLPFLQVRAAAGAFIVMRCPLRLFALGVELHPHLVNYLEILLGEVFVFIPARLLVDRHWYLALPYLKIYTARENA
jgi:hypothetical protein